MKTLKYGFAALALAATVPAFAVEAEEEEEGAVGWTPVAIGIASPLQLPWGLAKWDVFGLDINALYSDAPCMYGLGLGGVAMTTRDDMIGLQVSGLCNWALKDVYGMRVTLGANVTRNAKVYGVEIGAFGMRDTMRGWDTEFLGTYGDRIWGVQLSGICNILTEQSYGAEIAGLGNYSKTAYGLQLGCLYNHTWELHGCQIGLVNFARECPWGFQIGLINIILDNRLKVLPLVNGYF